MLSGAGWQSNQENPQANPREAAEADRRPNYRPAAVRLSVLDLDLLLLGLLTENSPVGSAVSNGIPRERDVGTAHPLPPTRRAARRRP